jgi:hypothetical protein
MIILSLRNKISKLMGFKKMSRFKKIFMMKFWKTLKYFINKINLYIVKICKFKFKNKLN